jgi:hypothetical protein
MSTGHIEQEYRINDVESLVHMRIIDDDANETHFVAVAIHPPDIKVSFRSIERADVVDASTLFTIRTMFKGQHVDRIIHKENAIDFDAKTLHMSGATSR